VLYAASGGVGLRFILVPAAPSVVGSPGGGGPGLAPPRRHRPDVMLLDVRMPEVDGLAVLHQLAGAPHRPAVAMLTTFDSADVISQAVNLGAAGFLLKDTEPEQLLHAVRLLAAGGSVLSPAVIRTVVAGNRHGGVRSPNTARLEAMSPRERHVLALVGQGLSNAEIGQRLHLSTGTVKDYVSAVLVRLGVSNRVQAAVVARDAGVLPPSEDEGGSGL
jgi:DNA-binding NarL/FixJ family response regulator